ncbi:MAG: DUF1266 domain-containing protein [Spirochaetaceae bacterium]|nr:DUF1266 domain-containing protein [Spirochaetaceae bacterium]
MKKTAIIWVFLSISVILSAAEKAPLSVLPECLNGWVSTGSNKSFEISAAESYSVPTRIGTVEMGSNISLAPYFRQKGISLGKSPEEVLPVIQKDDAFIPVNKPVSYSLNKNMHVHEPFSYSSNKDMKEDMAIYRLNYLVCFLICRENPQYCLKMQFSSFYYYRDGTMVLDGVYVFKRDKPFTTADSFFRYVRDYERDYKGDKERILKWSDYTQEEKDFCILSFPQLRFWAMEVTELKVDSKKALDKLNQVWNINSRTELLQFIVDSKAGRTGAQPAGLIFQMYFDEEENNYKMITASDYNRLKTLLDKYKDIDQIAISECLDIRDIAALYFIQKMQDRLGEHGLLAWDYGLYLVMLRLALSVDWITKEEALQWAKPLMEELYAAYSSWEDYTAHYTIGFGLDENYLACSVPVAFVRTRHMVDSICAYDVLFDSVSDSDSNASVFTFHNAPFTGTAKNGDPELTYNDVWYSPSYEAELYMSANSYFRYMADYINTDDQANLKKLISQKKNIPVVCYLDAFFKSAGYDLSKNPSPSKMFSFFNSIEPKFRNAVTQSRFYCNFYCDYALIAFGSNKINKMFEALERLNEENRMTPEAQFLYGMYYSIKMLNEKDLTKQNQYTAKIVSCFENAKTRYKADEEIRKILESIYGLKFEY